MNDQTDTSIVNDLLSRVRESAERLTETRHCSGTYALSSNTGGIAYRKAATGTEAGWVDFTSPNLSEADLTGLVDACDAATFGRGNEDVLDPSYRKAWKLDTSRLAFWDAVHGALLRFNDSSLKINAQLYKLNVYGPGSHFKSHLDTPRSDKMFAHWGDLTLRFKDTAWTFESSKMLSKTGGDAGTGDSAARLAWHEVSVVESGYRVSVTYNLLLLAGHSCPPLPSVTPHLAEEDSLRLPIGKDLSEAETRSKHTPVGPISDVLKGTDALVKRVCNELGLECDIKGSMTLTDGDKFNVYLTDKAVYGERMDEAPNLRVVNAFAGEAALKPRHSTSRGWRGEKILAPVIRVLWATPANKLTTVETTVVTYGNEPGVGWFYASLVLVAMIPSYVARSQAKAA
ncbi:hypothetical protein FA13DRAFT_1750189 [Coprinellus micaceus]|uniref:Fe2OG dioxygenase domain-containing protein n=1 Tax=Coprinellus micaceus TaxID=71717 RepID=A0A4Y7R893_COPMI|nr:hypothetical protein FA13DRAFT_1750189 [Coprinellus micaceus]